MSTHKPSPRIIASCVAALMLLGTATTAAAQSLHAETDQYGHRKITNVFDAGSPAPAEKIAVAFYKQVDSGQGTSYSDGTDGALSAPVQNSGAVSSNEVARALARNTVMSSRRAALIDASEATRRLAQAQRERRLGIAVLPGEDNRVAQPGAPVSRYQSRQNRLDSRVQSAQLRVSYTQR